MLPATTTEPDFIAARFRIFDFRRRSFTLLHIRLQRNLDGAWSPEVQRQEFDEFAGVDDLLRAGEGTQVAQIIHLDAHLAFSGKHITFSKTTVCSHLNQLTENCVNRLLDFHPASPRLKFFKRLQALRNSRCSRVRVAEPTAVAQIQRSRTYTISA
jgi:hypothetical protein